MKSGDKVIAKKEYHPMEGWTFSSKIGSEYDVDSLIGKYIVRIDIKIGSLSYLSSFGLYKDKRRLRKYKLPAFSEYFYTEQEIRKLKIQQLNGKK